MISPIRQRFSEAQPSRPQALFWIHFVALTIITIRSSPVILRRTKRSVRLHLGAIMSLAVSDRHSVSIHCYHANGSLTSLALCVPCCPRAAAVVMVVVTLVAMAMVMTMRLVAVMMVVPAWIMTVSPRVLAVGV